MKRKRKIIQASALVLAFSLTVGTTVQVQSKKHGESESLAYIWSVNQGSWDLDAPGPMVGSEFNTTLHWDSPNNLKNYIDGEGGAVKAVELNGVEVGKALYDFGLSESIYTLQHCILTQDTMYGFGLADYKYLRDHGLIMTPKTSYYWGIKVTENMTLSPGQKKQIKSENTPVHYGKLLQSQRTYAQGGRVKRYAYFVKPSWKSSNESVATVDEAGKVRAVKKGKAKITVTYTIWTMNRRIKYSKDGKKINGYWADTGQYVKYGTASFETQDRDGWHDMAAKYDVVRTCNIQVK